MTWILRKPFDISIYIYHSTVIVTSKSSHLRNSEFYMFFNSNFKKIVTFLQDFITKFTILQISSLIPFFFLSEGKIIKPIIRI